jgi:hypothetical protein
MRYPVTFTAQYPERSSRGQVLLRLFFGWLYVGIPHGVCLLLYGIASAVVDFIAFWAILFTGKYPKGMFDFSVGYLRWLNNVSAYMMNLTDEYPPFTGKQQ